MTSTAPLYWPSAVELSASDPSSEPGPMQETYFERLWRTRAKVDQEAQGPAQVVQVKAEAQQLSSGHIPSDHPAPAPQPQAHSHREPIASEAFARDQFPPPPTEVPNNTSTQGKTDEAPNPNANWMLSWSNQGQGPFPRNSEEPTSTYPSGPPSTSNRFSQLLQAKLAAEQPREQPVQPSYPAPPFAAQAQPTYPPNPAPHGPAFHPPLAVPPSPWAAPPPNHAPQLESSQQPPQQLQWGLPNYPRRQYPLHTIPMASDTRDVDLNTLQPVPPPWQQPLSNSPYAQMAHAAQNRSGMEQKPHIPDQSVAPDMSWYSTTQLGWQPTESYPRPPWQLDVPPSGSQPDYRPRSVSSQTPALTHRSCDSVDSIEPPVTPLNSIHRLPLVDPAYSKPHGPYHPPMAMASDMPPNGDMSGGGYIGVGQNPHGSANGSGNGELPSGFGDDHGDLPGDGGNGGGGSGDDGQDDQNGGPPTGSARKRVKLPLACHFCRRRKLKCDGKRPECDNCTKRGETCLYDEHVRRRGPGKRTKEMRDKAAREAEEAGMTNPNSAANPVAGPSTLDPADFSGVIDDQNLNVDGIELHGHHYEGDGVMEAMDAVMGAGIQLDMGADEGAIHMARVGIEGIEGLADQHDLMFGEPSTLAELGAIDPALRALGSGDAVRMGGEDMKGKKRKMEGDQGFEEPKSKMERQG